MTAINSCMYIDLDDYHEQNVVSDGDVGGVIVEVVIVVLVAVEWC